MRPFDESAPVAALLAARSASIKDLRHGSSTNRSGTAPTRIRGTAAVHRVPQATVRDNNIAATLSAGLGRLGHCIGDLVVPGSALAPTPPARVHLICGLRHGDLLAHDTAYAKLLNWLRA